MNVVTNFNLDPSELHRIFDMVAQLTGTRPTGVVHVITIGSMSAIPNVELLPLMQAFLDSTPPGPPPVTSQVLKQLVDGELCLDVAHLQGSKDCSICLDEHEVGGRGIVLPCSHVYHKDCLVPWLSQHNTCPMCRLELVAAAPTAAPPAGKAVLTHK
eukprot:TRINITY_DN12915_c0_g1_i1.p1 TRINITY_DN12915_c0_g1~~TRINITY_DN12915_c0_g1_i1.p1  ORF type:complete len:169 (+),score=8.20 TRINITY_DN12915_c0_g1_i1:37-507(+)